VDRLQQPCQRRPRFGATSTAARPCERIGIRAPSGMPRSPGTQASMIHRYIIWRNNHADDERLRRCRRRPAVWPGGWARGPVSPVSRSMSKRGSPASKAPIGSRMRDHYGVVVPASKTR
jgi:hypothetical protein